MNIKKLFSQHLGLVVAILAAAVPAVTAGAAELDRQPCPCHTGCRRKAADRGIARNAGSDCCRIPAQQWPRSSGAVIAAH